MSPNSLGSGLDLSRSGLDFLRSGRNELFQLRQCNPVQLEPELQLSLTLALLCGCLTN